MMLVLVWMIGFGEGSRTDLCFVVHHAPYRVLFFRLCTSSTLNFVATTSVHLSSDRIIL